MSREAHVASRAPIHWLEMTPELLRPSSRLPRVAKGVLPGFLVAALLVFGLLAMHGIGLHGVAGGHGTSVRIGSASPDASEHSAHPPISGIASHQAPDAGPVHDAHLGMAMVCAFALLLLVSIQRGWHLRTRSTWKTSPLVRTLSAVVGSVRPRSPSLHALGISRT